MGKPRSFFKFYKWWAIFGFIEIYTVLKYIEYIQSQDIAKAFDTINFNIVIQKLARFGYDERFLKFFASYLVNRQQRVKIADRYSTFSKISSWGPQRSIFAVFLFSVYINDLPDQLINKTFVYANDTKIIGQISEREDLQFGIKRAIEWSGSNKLNFNFHKLSILEFSYKNSYDSSTELIAKSIAIKNKKQFKDFLRPAWNGIVTSKWLQKKDFKNWII